MELSDDMTLTESLQYVLQQYETPEWLDSAIIKIASNWEALHDGPNYGQLTHPDDWPDDKYCVCDECLSCH